MLFDRFTGITGVIAQLQDELHVRPDGIFGPASQRALVAARSKPGLPRSTRFVLGELDALGIKITPSGKLQLVLPVDKRKDICDRVASGLRLDASFLDRLFSLESSWNAVATSATGYVGLGQLGRAAMRDVHSVVGSNVLSWRAVNGRVIGLSDWYDADANASCAGLYIRELKRRYHVSEGPFLYGIYNLGYDSAKDIFLHGRTPQNAEFHANSALGANARDYATKVAAVFDGSSSLIGVG